MNKFIYLLLIFIVFNSCNMFETPDDELNLVRQNYKGDELRIDGYYYRNINIYNTIYYQMFFLYSNGVIFGGISTKETGLAEFEVKFADGTFYNNYSQFIYYWGLFEINNEKIIYEKWMSTWPPYQAYTYEGEILNDTTFVITESYRIVNGEITEYEVENKTFHFKKFSPKPDSTNSFIP